MSCDVARNELTDIILHQDKINIESVGTAIQERCQSANCGNPHCEPIAFNGAYVTWTASGIEDVVVEENRILSLAYWKRARGDSIKAAVIEALRSIGKPATFSEIADVLRNTDAPVRSISKRQVQTCLGNGIYSEFRLAGPGTYGLSEWGFEKYKSSTEAVLDLLLNNGGPMEVAQIINRLTRDNKYTESNIRRVLLYDKRIVRTSEAIYDLKERVENNSHAIKATDVVLDIGDKREVSITIYDLDSVAEEAKTSLGGINKIEKVESEGGIT